MMKNIKSIARNYHVRTLMLILCGMCFLLVSCNDGDEFGPPTITKITKTDPVSIAKDSTFTQAFANQMIVIHGDHFYDLKEVYFNDLKAYFNANYATANSIIVTIPANTPNAATHPGVPDNIRVVTGHGEATFAFRLLVPAPAIAAISNEFANPGETITIYGSNLFIIDKVIFPGNLQGTDIKMTGGTVLTVKVPATPTTGGKLILSNQFGADTASFRDNTGMLCDFDAKNTYSWGAVRKNDAQPFTGSQGYYGLMEFKKVATNNWSSFEAGRTIALSATQLVPVAELANAIGDYALKFEIFVKEPWKTGTLVMRPRDNWTYVHMFRPWKIDATTGIEYKTEGWRTVTVPLNRFLTKKNGLDGTGDPAKTLKAILGDTGNGTFVFAFVNDSAVAIESFSAALDNIRIVNIK